MAQRGRRGGEVPYVTELYRESPDSLREYLYAGLISTSGVVSELARREGVTRQMIHWYLNRLGMRGTAETIRAKLRNQFFIPALPKKPSRPAA